MNSQTIQNLGDAIFSDIDNNPFLNELYDNILYNYAITKFNLSDKRQMREIDVMSALRFADLLSKAPVGSSAKINLGFVIMALADATLCFCPPDIW